MSMGCGYLRARFDVESAYRNVALHTGDRCSFGISWRGHRSLIPLHAWLPQDKFHRVVSLLADWLWKRHYKNKALESFIGPLATLQYACKVAPQGRTFLRRMIIRYLPSVMITTQFGLTWSSTWISPGGRIACYIGYGAIWERESFVGSL